MLSSHGMSCVSSFQSQSSIPALLPLLPSPPLISPPLPSPPFRFTCTTKLMFRWAGPMGLVSVEGRRGDWPLPFSYSISHRCVCVRRGVWGGRVLCAVHTRMHTHTYHTHTHTRHIHTHTHTHTQRTRTHTHTHTHTHTRTHTHTHTHCPFPLPPTHPQVLVLDEPTSGLDSTASFDLLTMLNQLTKSNRTIILTIHQPRLEIFHMFHKIVFLCEGQVRGWSC